MEINISSSSHPRVVIIGGGFSGLAIVRELLNKNFQIVLIDKNNYHQFQPLLYQVATSSLEPTSISMPLRRIFKGYSEFHFIMAEVDSINTDKSIIHTNEGYISFDYLIIAAGTDTNYFGMDDIKENSLPLKSISEALGLRNSLYINLEKANIITSNKEKQPYLNFVIVGGGATGVELAGAFAELKSKIIPKDFPSLDTSLIHIYLLNATDRLLEAYCKRLSNKALLDLKKMGVEVMLNCKVQNYDGKVLTYNDTNHIETRTFIWASGVIANKFEGIDATDRGRRILTNEYCKVYNNSKDRVYDNIFAIGDIAIIKDYPLPQIAQVAIQEGRYVADLISKRTTLPFKYINKGSMATIGRNRAVAQIGKYSFGGFFAWILWLFVHLMYIVGFRNRLWVLWDWGWNYIAEDQPLRAIIIANRKKHE